MLRFDGYSGGRRTLFQISSKFGSNFAKRGVAMETSFTLQAVLKWGALKTKKSTLLSLEERPDVLAILHAWRCVEETISDK